MFSTGNVQGVRGSQEYRWQNQETMVPPEVNDISMEWQGSDPYSFEDLVGPSNPRGSEGWFVEQSRPGQSVAGFTVERQNGGQASRRATSGCSVAGVGATNGQQESLAQAFFGLRSFFSVTLDSLNELLSTWSSHDNDAYRENWSSVWHDTAAIR